MRKIGSILLVLACACIVATPPEAIAAAPGIHITATKASQPAIGIQSLTIDHDTATSSAGVTNASTSESLPMNNATAHASSRPEVRPATIAVLNSRDPGDGDTTDTGKRNLHGPDDDDGERTPLAA